MGVDSLRKAAFRTERFSLRMAWIIARRELSDTLHDWRILLPICVLILAILRGRK